MKIEGTHEIDAPRPRVYQSLTDPEVLRRCIPGCERLEAAEENVFAATIRTGVGSIKGVFNGTVKLEEMRQDEHFRLVVEGKGTPGFLKGAGNLDLDEQGEITLIRYTGDVQVGGTIASVGQRMIQATAKMMASQFFTAVEAEAKSKAGGPPPQHGFFRTALRWFSGWVRRKLRMGKAGHLTFDI
jgi:carbon monoxide dehydrogenase subunit G